MEKWWFVRADAGSGEAAVAEESRYVKGLAAADWGCCCWLKSKSLEATKRTGAAACHRLQNLNAHNSPGSQRLQAARGAERNDCEM